MVIVHVHIHVKNEYIKDFINLTLENARNSIQENGVIRFDFFQKADEPNKFLLVEMYHDESDVLAHKQTPHYAYWKTGVEEMMAEPRLSIRYNTIFPEEKGF